MSKPTTLDQVKTLLSAVGVKIKEVGKRIPVKLSQLENDLEPVISDWDQTDEAQADYVKNRPCGVVVKQTEEQIFDTKCVLSQASSQSICYAGVISDPDSSIVFKEGSLYNVYFEGVLYENLTCFRDSFGSNTYLTIGESNNSKLNTWDKNDYSYMKYPFALLDGSTVGHYITVQRTLGNFRNGSSVRVILSEVIPEEVQTLPEKYLPESVIKHVVLNASSSTDTNGNVTYSADKTFDEITTALADGYDVVAYYDGYRYEFHGDRDTDWTNESSIVFGHCDISANGDSNDAMVKPIEIGLFRDNSVHISDEGFSKLNTTDKSIVGAINEVNEKVDTVNDALGTDELDTTDKTIIGAINEVNVKATPFIINVTGSGTEDDPYTSDETFEEIKQAYDDGKELKCIANVLYVSLDSEIEHSVTEKLQFVGVMWDAYRFRGAFPQGFAEILIGSSEVHVEINPLTSHFLSKDNVLKYTPTEDYHPATKKYVDDAVPLIINVTKNPEGGYYTSEIYEDISSSDALLLVRYNNLILTQIPSGRDDALSFENVCSATNKTTVLHITDQDDIEVEEYINHYVLNVYDNQYLDLTPECTKYYIVNEELCKQISQSYDSSKIANVTIIENDTLYQVTGMGYNFLTYLNKLGLPTFVYVFVSKEQCDAFYND